MQESEEGYVPSEDEVVTLHLVAAMGYLKLQRWEDAEVEARRASFYLENQFNEHQPHFDDPALRLWLAGVWPALGEWDSARVDLRVAAKLSADEPEIRTRLTKLADGEPPAEFDVFFAGVAPELKWIDGHQAPQILTPVGPPTHEVVFSTEAWFRHHQERNTVLRDTLVKSNYMAQYLTVEGSTAVVRGGGHSLAFVIGTAGVVLGLAIIGGGIYIISEVGLSASEDVVVPIIAAGSGVAYGSYKYAQDFDNQIQKSIDQDRNERIEDLRTYRLVRFLPAWISLSTKSSARNGIFEAAMGRTRRFEIQRPGARTRVNFSNEF